MVFVKGKWLNSLSEIRKVLGLISHPEGGGFCETYRATSEVTRVGGGRRAASTAIYYMLEQGECSALHRIASDEVWHFYQGDPLRVTMIDPVEGSCTSFVLGPALDRGQQFQAMVPAGWWFGARVEPGGEYTLAGCTVAPGFSFEDFELADRAQLLAEFPTHREVILALTRP